MQLDQRQLRKRRKKDKRCALDSGVPTLRRPPWSTAGWGRGCGSSADPRRKLPAGSSCRASRRHDVPYGLQKVRQTKSAHPKSVRVQKASYSTMKRRGGKEERAQDGRVNLFGQRFPPAILQVRPHDRMSHLGRCVCQQAHRALELNLVPVL